MITYDSLNFNFLKYQSFTAEKNNNIIFQLNTFYIFVFFFYTDPDIMKGDGIYSRYFNPMIGGPGIYTFEITVSDSGSNAYTWQHSTHRNTERTSVNTGQLKFLIRFFFQF